MKVNILLFGRLSELFGQHQLHMEDVPDTDALNQRLAAQCPDLSGIKYRMAVDQLFIQDNKVLSDGMTVALMPPFSGG